MTKISLTQMEINALVAMNFTFAVMVNNDKSLREPGAVDSVHFNRSDAFQQIIRLNEIYREPEGWVVIELQELIT